MKILRQLKSTIYFVAILLTVHLVWKFGFSEGLDLSGNSEVTFFGYDVSAFFLGCAMSLAKVVYGLLTTLTSLAITLEGNIVHFTDAHFQIHIVWSCTGIKQMIFFTLLILCYPKRTWHKAWVIPASLVVIYVINVLRIALIIYFCDCSQHRFDILHEGSKYVFYAILFGMWLAWDCKHEPDHRHRE